MPPTRRLWADQGGTFTDIVELDARGRLSVRKVLSDRVEHDALARAADEVRRGTTVATNALLERTGRPVLLLTTTGFGDAPWIGDQRRPELFALHIQRPEPLCTGVVEVAGRIGLGPGERSAFLLEAHTVDVADLRSWVRRGVEAAAVVLVHGPLVPEEEVRLGEACRRAGFSQVSLGHEVAPSRGFLARLHTTLADAALTPLLPTAPGAYMKSDGGLAEVDAAGHGPEWRGSQAVLSGPAGGVVATAALVRTAGCGPAFGFDMGGTSTDVSRIEGEPDRVEVLNVGGVRLRVPAVRVETVAAGGGSVLGVHAGVYEAGPGSAGADPGPACYGRGGPAAVSDCAAVLGRLPGFPEVAGPDRDCALDLEAARRALRALDPDRPVEEVAAGFERVAVETMARAIRTLAVGRGVDPAAHALVAFGGAGPGHACAVARALGIREVLVPLLAGVFSAVGIGMARPRIERVAHVHTTAAEAWTRLRALLQDATPAWTETGRLSLRYALRHVGQATVLEVEVDADDPDDVRIADELDVELSTRFHARHRERFGFSRPEAPLELVELRATIWPDGPERGMPTAPEQPRLPRGSVRAWFGGWREVPWLRGEDADGALGPAIVQGPGSTLVVAPGWRVEVARDHLRLVDLGAAPPGLGLDFHPVHTAVLGSRVMAIAEQMGERLALLARSVSIRERRDFSCAVFDQDGHLVANAPHVPVHLGAMGHTVRDLLARRGGAVRADTAWASNDPYAGGSHLPDITVVMPVVEGGRRIAFIACRGHHVDVGGRTPGSMPPRAQRIEEEGLLLHHSCILSTEGFVVPEALQLSPEQGGSRQPEEVIADLEAQVAACSMGVEGVLQLSASLGADVLMAQLGHLQDHAEAAVLALLPRLRSAADRTVQLDAGGGGLHPLRVSWRVEEQLATLELSSARHPDNLNAPRAVAIACMLYVMRCLLHGAGAHELPLNEGALRPLRLQVEPGGLFDPGPPAAVAGGNVETSQRLVDALLASLGALAGSQGTMNNLTVGTPAGAFYETIGGGAGAGPDFDGAHGVQVHMTNTLATDVEELEARFPVRLLRHSRRHGSAAAAGTVVGTAS